MPPVPGFSDNPFRTRSDLIRAAVALLKPLEQYKSVRGARIKIATETGAGFDEIAAQLEGFSRPFWAVASLLNIVHSDANGANPAQDSVFIRQELNLATWIHGIGDGVDPSSPEYWGDLGDFDQRMVEMESIAYALLTAPSIFEAQLSKPARPLLERWLKQINGKKLPQNNWLWFRVFVNLALGEAAGSRETIEADLDTLETFELGDGWSSDGLWGDERRQVDYYSGSFAIQFARMLYVKIVSKDKHPLGSKERAAKYIQDAQRFASDFWRYFDTNGAAIPFGRSLTYRFAFAAFWSAVAVAGVELPPPLNHLGAVKGLVLRHLRWWSQHHGIFNTDGTLNIGHTYPNMYMSEEYNSPQSVYWCLKSFIILDLPESHPFWTCEELPHPLETTFPSGPQAIDHMSLLWPPKQILCNTQEHHFLLSAGQSTRRNHKAREAKYSKLAYSSAFGFSVPTGPALAQSAPDSTISISIDDGDTWKFRWEPFSVQVSSSEKFRLEPIVNTLVSSWKPWRNVDLEVQTELIPMMQHFPGWHVRVHKVTWRPSHYVAQDTVQFVDGGFAVSRQTSSGSTIARKEMTLLLRDTEGFLEGAGESLVISSSGASGIVDLTSRLKEVSGLDGQGQPVLKTEAEALRPDPNTNLMVQRTLIPILRHTIKLSSEPDTTDGSHGLHEQSQIATKEVWLCTGVFGISRRAKFTSDQIQRCWLRRPF